MGGIKSLREKVKDLKVLFVDDEKDLRNGTGVFLRKFFDDVVVCNNGQEGLAAFLKDENFDVVITDVMMPIMDGIEMVKEIRKLNSNVFIIFLTASRSLLDSENDLSDLVLRKPISFEDITLVMHKLEDIS